MEESHGRTVRRATRRRKIGLLSTLPALVALAGGGCAGRYAGPRSVASIGALTVLAGSASWAAGDRTVGGTDTSRGLVNAGLVSVAVGLAAIVVAGGWMAGSVACHADPDCDEEEQCREIPAPPGGVPYKQCMPR
jgi:hypothetical protein